jgi:hypothetical protein
MNRARIGILTLAAAAAAPILSLAAPAPAAPKTDSAACAAPAPRPMLKKEAYRDYSFEPGPENTALEKASTGTLHIEVQYSGCRDGVEHGFMFEDGNPLADYSGRDHWLAFAAEQLKALKTFRRGQEDVKDLLPFLDSAKSAVTRTNGKDELRLEVCRDGSPTSEDGCSLGSGGGYRFSVRQVSPQRVAVYVSRYYALKPK